MYLRVANESDFFTVHIGFPSLYYPHYGMRFIIRDNGKDHQMKVSKGMTLNDILYEIKAKKVYVYDEEVDYYHKRLKRFGIFLLKKIFYENGHCFGKNM